MSISGLAISSDILLFYNASSFKIMSIYYSCNKKKETKLKQNNDKTLAGHGSTCL